MVSISISHTAVSLLNIKVFCKTYVFQTLNILKDLRFHFNFSPKSCVLYPSTRKSARGTLFSRAAGQGFELYEFSTLIG
jgi:hypothetical protein